MTHFSWTQNPWHLVQTESQTKLCEYCSYQSSIAVKNWLLREVDLQNPALVTLTSKYHELQYSASIIPKSQSGTGFLRSTVSSHPRCCGSSWNRASPCAKNINPWLSATNGLINPLNHPLYRLIIYKYHPSIPVPPRSPHYFSPNQEQQWRTPLFWIFWVVFQSSLDQLNQQQMPDFPQNHIMSGTVQNSAKVVRPSKPGISQ